MKFIPHDYQRFCTEYIKTHPIAALFLDMGLGYPSCPDPSCLCRTWPEHPAGRTHPDLVRIDMELGAVSADQRPTVAAGTDTGGHHPPHHHQGHRGRGCHGRLGTERYDTGKVDLSSQSTAGGIGAEE